MLANEAMPVAEVSRAEAEQRLADAEAAYDGGRQAATSPALDAAMDRMQSARAMMEAAQAGMKRRDRPPCRPSRRSQP